MPFRPRQDKITATRAFYELKGDCGGSLKNFDGPKGREGAEECSPREDTRAPGSGK